MSPKESKQIAFWVFLHHSCSHWFGLGSRSRSGSRHKAVMDLGGSQSKIKCPYPVKGQNFQMISLGKFSSFTLISTELPLIFSARSGPFWQEAKALKKHSCFQPSDLGQAGFSQRKLDKKLIFLIQVVKILILCNFYSWKQHEPQTM